MPENSLKRVTFHVPNMACSHCRTSISETLGKSGGVVHTDVNLFQKTVTVDYDPARTTLDDLKQALTRAGYPPQGGSEGQPPAG